jgi:hypothetical protein
MPLSSGIVLDLAKNYSFLIWKLVSAHTGFVDGHKLGLNTQKSLLIFFRISLIFSAVSSILKSFWMKRKEI